MCDGKKQNRSMVILYFVLAACLLTALVVALSSWQLFRYLYVPVVRQLTETGAGFKLKRGLARADEADSGDFYGELRVSHRTLVVGAPFRTKKNTGAVYVQSCDEDGCSHDQLFVGNEPGGQLGTRVAISQNGSVVAAYADQGRAGLGRVSLFRRASNGERHWSKVEQLHHPADTQGFGARLAVSPDGTSVLVAAQEDRRVWTYVHAKGRWYLRDTAKKDANVVGLHFSALYGPVVLTETGLYVNGRRWWTKGIGFRAEPTMLAVGTKVVAVQFENFGDAHGTVLLFHQGETTERLQPDSMKAGDAFGVSCAVSEDDSTVVVGSSVSSRACVFRALPHTTGRYRWVQQLSGTLGFGRCVGISRDARRLYVSSHSSDKQSMSGHVFYYEWLD